MSKVHQLENTIFDRFRNPSALVPVDSGKLILLSLGASLNKLTLWLGIEHLLHRSPYAYLLALSLNSIYFSAVFTVLLLIGT